MGLYYLQNNAAMTSTCSQGEQVLAKPLTGQNLQFQKWHLRLGHSAATTMQHIAAIKKCITKSEVCITCPMAKFTELPYTLSDSRAALPFDLIHIDTWGP